MTQKNLLQSAGDGRAVPAGYVGETIVSAPSETSGASSTGTTIGTLPLTNGIWSITFSGAVVNAAGVISAIDWSIRLTTNVALNPNYIDYYSNVSDSIGGNAYFPSANTVRGYASTSVVVAITSDTTFYLRTAFSVTGGGSVGIKAVARAVRIA